MADTNITWRELAPLLKTGDIVLVQGSSHFQEIISKLTGSSFIHMAMVVLSKDIGLKDQSSPILLWESTPYAITEDERLHKAKAGPTLVDAEKRINDELARGIFSRFIFRRLNHELGPDNFKGLNNAIQKIYPDKFPTDFMFFVKGILGRLFGLEVNKKAFFCSELIGYTYQQMGILGKEHPADFYEPKDFSDKGHLPLHDNLSLGEDLILELKIRE